jgi:hypothetical protein
MRNASSHSPLLSKLPAAICRNWEPGHGTPSTVLPLFGGAMAADSAGLGGRALVTLTASALGGGGRAWALRLGTALGLELAGAIAALSAVGASPPAGVGWLSHKTLAVAPAAAKRPTPSKLAKLPLRREPAARGAVSGARMPWLELSSVSGAAASRLPWPPLGLEAG